MSKEKRSGRFFDPVIRYLLYEFAKERRLEIALDPEVFRPLREILSRPNPKLKEYPFLGLGTPDAVDQFLLLEGESSSRGLYFINKYVARSDVEQAESAELFNMVQERGRLDDIVMLGHTHPSGSFRSQPGVDVDLSPSALLLSPSMGTGDGGPQSGGDLAYYRYFREYNPHLQIPYAGIAANTPEGPKLRVYLIDELLTIQRYRHIDSVPQVTFLL